MENVESIYPLSPMQLEILLRALQAPELAEYTEQIRWTMRGDLDADAFERAWRWLAGRHPVLRTVFFWKGLDTPVQVVRRAVEVRVELHDLSGLPPAEREERMEELARRERRGFDLEAAPLFRIVCARTGEGEHRCVWSWHHLLLDGWSAGQALREMFAGYEAIQAGRRPDLPPATPFQAYISWLQAQRPDEAEAFWRDALAGADPPSALPLARPRDPGESEAPGLASATLPATLVDRLQEAARRRRLTLNTLFQGAWALVLGRHRGDEDVVFGAVSSGRPAELPGAESMLGVFLGTVPVRVRLRPESGATPWLREIQAAQTAARRHEHWSLRQVHEWSGAALGERLFDTLLVFQNTPLAEVESARVAGLELRDLRAVPADTALGHALMLEVTVLREAVLNLAYDGHRWDPEPAGRMLEHLRTVLEGMASDPEARLAALPLLTDAERLRVTREWNDTQVAYPPASIHELVSAQAARTPDAPAVAFEGRSLTYAELESASNRLARHLRGLGVGPETRVGVCAERSPELVVALLAVLRAGGAYVPLDPSYPAGRLAYMLEDSGIPVLLTQERLLERLPAHGARVVCLDRDADRIAAESAEPPAPAADPRSLAYVIYTSGSTGRPKGAMNEHAGVVNRLLWMQEEYGLDASDTVLQKTPFSFDVSVWEFFWPLIAGARLVLARPEGHRDPGYLAELIERERVTTLHFVPPMLQAFLEAAGAGRCGCVRRVVCSGEALPWELTERFFAAMPGAELHNLYGPTEAAVDVTFHRCGGEADRTVPIGRPVANTRVYVLDAWGEPVPVGVPGELYIGGVQVGRGYLGRPELTAERFVPDPFGGEAGARLYRTGDRARWRADGEVEYLGRLDDQAKVRGFRIEPGEIESALLAHERVREAVVAVREDVPGERRLVAYVVPRPGSEAPAAEELRTHLRERLPEYMVPGAFVALEALPLTPSGKTDRRALPAPDGPREEGYAAPRTPAEERLAAIWSEVLRVERVGVHDAFAALGGHSLLATRVISRVHDAFGIDLPLRAMFEAPTVAALAKRIGELAGSAAGDATFIPRRSGDGPVPLSSAQRRLWLLDRMEPGSAAYNVPAALRLRGALDARALRHALAGVARRHESLRTVFAVEAGEPVQVVRPAGPVALPAADLSALPPEARERELRRLAAAEAARPFDLERGPLLRATLVRLDAAEHAVLFTMHHVVSDGWSVGVLVRDLSELYAALVEGRGAALPELPVQYADYALWQRERLAGDALEAQLAFWRGALADAPPLLELPTDRPRPALPATPGAELPFALSPAATRGLRELAEVEGATPFMALATGWTALLSRWSGQDDVLVGTPVAGRTRTELEGLIGLFINTLVLRTSLAGEPTLRELLGRVRETTLAAQSHADVPFERLVEELAPERSLRHAPLFQVMLALQNHEAGELRLPGLELVPLDAPVPLAAKFDMELSLEERQGGIGGYVVFRADLWDASTVARMLEGFRTLLEALAADPDRRLPEVEILPPAEREQVVRGWNATARTYPLDRGAHALFAARAAAAPEAVAVRSGGDALTYAELDARAAALSLRLRGLGVGPEARVGLLLERTPELLAAVLGTWQAGGAYVPLDPAYPAERIAWMLADAAPRVVVTTRTLAAGLPAGGVETVLVDEQAPSPGPSPNSGGGENDTDGGERQQGDAPPPERGRVAAPRPPGGGAAAYVIYTSGSTGTPKGVVVTHGALANLLHATREAFGVEAGDVVPALASPSFDIWLFETLLPLTTGATVRLVPRERVMDPERLVEEVADATVLHAVPALMRQVVRAAGGLPRLRRAFVGGDRVPPDLLDEMRAAFPAAEAHVLYGPTEATVLASTRRVPAEEEDGAHRIGAPLPNVRVYVCDAAGNPQPVGVAGEVWIGGEGVARGYLGRPELTAERFVPDALSGEAGARLYRTGDRARWRAEGELEFLGRTDAQVKVRGFRIEPGEVEAALLAHGGVREAVAVAREDAPGDARLVAYVVPADRGGAELWPSIGEYFVYDELIYQGLTHDTLRNARYLRALRQHAPGKVVLDVGTGADAILARLAVEAGARHVYAVELLERSFLSARERIRELGLEDRVTVVHGDARTVELPEPADVCVSEIVESIAGGEGAALILDHARRLLAPGAAMIPGRAWTRVAAVTLPEEVRGEPAFPRTAAHYVRRIWEEVGHPFDLRLCIRGFPATHVLSTAGTFEELDFAAGAAAAEYVRREELAVERAGRLDGLLLWLRMELAEGETLDILEEDTAWFPVYFPLFDPGIDVAAGDRLRLECFAELPEGGVAPDYGVRGVLARAAGGEEVPFEFVSVHHAPRFRADPFYRRLFADGEVPLREDAEEALPDALREHLRARLPEHMVPSAVVVLDALPLTPAGKVDRRALPAPDASTAGAYVAPRTPTEEVLAGIWGEVLGRERVGVEDDFFALGGHSLLATRVVSRVRDAFGVELPLRTLFEAPTAAALAGRVEALLRDGSGPQAPPLLPVPRDDAPLPLSFAQQRLWFIDRMEPGRATYNLPYALRVRGALELRALEHALAAVARRHESLRTRFPERGGEPVQVVDPPRPARIPLVDLAGLPEAAREAELARLAQREARRPFDLAAGPLLRTCAVRLGEADAALLFTLHHVVADGWSMGILVREVSALYGAGLRGEEARLPELPVQYADFAAWQRAWLSGETLERQLAWWRERLRGAPPLLELPVDRPRPAAMGDAGRRLEFRVDAAAGAALRALSRRESATPFMTLLAAWQLLLARYAGTDDVVVGTPIAGRDRLETEGLIGFFVNTLALRGEVRGEAGFLDLLRRARETTLGAYQHQEVPFERLVEELGVERSLAHAPLFQVMFAVQNNERARLRLGGAEVDALATGGVAAKFDLTLMLTDDGEAGLDGSLEYAAALWEPATMARLAEHFTTLLAGIAADPGARAADLPLMSPAERGRVLAEGNGPAAGSAPADLVHELVAAQAARTPDAAALVWRGERLTYAELHRRANRLANHLRARGVGPETRVGVCLERTPEMVVALLGVIKAGGAYVPLDPAYPRERLRAMMEDAAAGLVLTSAALAGRLPDGLAEPVHLDALRERIGAESDAAPETGVGPENLSHVIFTSGSTGRPKGVMIRHSSTAVLLHWLRGTVTDEERASVLFSTSISFDVSVAEIFGTLAWGGTLVMVENALELATVAEPVVHASMVPTAAAELLRMGRIPAGVRTLNLGGEPLPADLARELYALGTVEKVGNLYGPTEDTTYSTYSLVPHGAALVTVGRLVAGTRTYVLDAGLEPVPAGVVGELYLAGHGLSRGYAGRPELTAERFLPDPFGPAGSRMYRVMDRVRRRADGELEYFGRTDFQVKVRGFRIELGEIEAALRGAPGVRDAAAVVREDAPGDRRIVAYVVPANGTTPDPSELRARLAECVPEYMLPSAFVALETLPLTASGKTDRRALPAPEGAAAPVAGDEAPRTPTEEVLAGIFAELLGVERVGVRAGFFELGGHSLLAARASARAREAFGVELPLPVLFEAPTVAELAARVDELRGDGADAPRPPLLPVPRDGGPLPLSFAQQRLWLLHQVAPASYNLTAALRLRGELDVEAMRGALEAVVARHEALRTRFAVEGGEPVQVVEPPRPLALPVLDLAPFPEAEREAAVARYAGEEEARPFDLAAPPLLRASLLRLGGREHLLLLTLHHIAADGWSEAVLVREMGAHYAARVAGREAALPPLEVQYGDYAVWQRSAATGGARQRKLEFWSRTLAGVPAALELPSDRPRPPVQGFRGDTVRFRLDAPLADALRALARREDCTLFMTLLAGFDAWLHRYTGQDDLVVGTPLAGRDHPALEPLIGCFINVLPVRVRVDAGDGFRGLLRRVRAALLDAYPHGDVSFDRIVDAAGIPRDASRGPLVQVLFALQNTPMEPLRLPGVEAEPVEIAGQASRYDLGLYLSEEPDGALYARVELAADLFDRATVERWMRHFGRLLHALAADPDSPVGDAEMLDAAERAQIVHGWNATHLPLDASATIASLFEARARRTPHAEALVSGAERLTFAELDRRADHVARRLTEAGIGPESRVGILLDRTPEMVAAMLGVLKAGGAYVPLDPAYPAERIAYMLSDSGARVLLTEAGLATRVPAFGGEVVLVAENDTAVPTLPQNWGRVASLSEPGGGEPGGPSPDHAAYVIYTSGSTGRPKGVVVTHGNVAAFFAAMSERVGAEPGTWLALTGIGFDISVLEILWTLTQGSRVVLRGARPGAGAAAAEDPRPGAPPTAFSLFYFATGAEGRGRGKYRLLLEGAKWADRNGFEAVWTPERHFHAFGGLYPNPSVTSAALATITERVRLRAGSVVLPLHDPIRVAEEWAVVDNLSDGRVELSFASGWHTDDFALAPNRYEGRREAMFAGVEEVRRLWRGDKVARTGGSGAPVELGTLPRPLQPELPVWITAGGSPDTFRAAGRIGAHLLTHLLGQTVEELDDKVRAYREGRREGGHDPEAGRVALMLHTFVGDDADAVRETVRGPFREYLRTSFDLVLRLAGSAGMDPGRLSPADVEVLLDFAFERYYGTSGLMGTPDACLEMVRRVRGAGVDEVACLIDFGVDEELVLDSLDRLRVVMEAGRAGPAARDEAPIHEQIRAEGVTHLQCTPSLAGMLAADPEALRALGGLECILLGGEALPPALARRIREATPARLLNMYGPTEATVWSTAHEVEDAAGPVPIGRPVANTRAHVVDARLQPVPPGVAGELLVAGALVARGYLGRPDLTAERFLPDPFAAEPGARAYRTGDLARRRADGVLEFLGRGDQQVKVRGHRIEPGEVEAALDAHPGVRESAVVAVEDEGTGERRLAAYVVPAVSTARAQLPPAPPERRERTLAGLPRFTLPDGTIIAHQQDFITRELFREIFVDEAYLLHGITLEEGARVVDVGSNIGMFTLFAHARAPGVRTWSFEPIPATFEVLRANTALFGLDARVFNAGLADAEGTATFTFYPNSSGLSGRYADLERDRGLARAAIESWAAGADGAPTAVDVDAFLADRFRAETVACPIRTLSRVIREEGIERIDLLKVDVEKSEYDVLLGIEDEHWPLIRQLVMEVDTDELLERVAALLGRHGFEHLVDRHDVTVTGEGEGEHVYMLYAKRPGDGPPLRRTSPGAAARREPPTAAELRAYLAERLPDYMVPSLFVPLERMPRTPNGKTDRAALPRAAAPRAAPEAGYVAPRNALERTISEVWREVLGVERVGARDNFFELGGTSVGLAAVHHALSERLERPVAIVDLFRHSTVAALAEHLAGGAEAEAAAPPAHTGAQDRAERQRQARGARQPQRPGSRGRG